MPKTVLMPTTEVAAALDVDVRTVHRWVKAGLLVPEAKMPGLRGPYLFARAEVERFKSERVA